MVICLERDADLHMVQLMPLPLTVSCFSKIQIGFTFLVPAHPGSPGKGPLNGCVCVCVCVCASVCAGRVGVVFARCQHRPGAAHPSVADTARIYGDRRPASAVVGRTRDVPHRYPQLRGRRHHRRCRRQHQTHHSRFQRFRHGTPTISSQWQVAVIGAGRILKVEGTVVVVIISAKRRKNFLVPPTFQLCPPSF